jgi:PIN domain nuclease of toxin-antitoxin system
MNLLLDTHSFLWFIAGSPNLSDAARRLIEDATNQPFLSAASLWEMAIKLSLGKLQHARPFEELVPQQMRQNGIYYLGIDLPHVAPVATLPFHHHDSFDRLLIAQAMVESMPIVSADTAFDAYPVQRLW